MIKKIVSFFLLGGICILLLAPQGIAGVTSNVLGAGNAAGFTPQVSYLASSTTAVKYIAKAFFYIVLIMGLFFLAAKYLLPRSGFNIGSEQFKVIRKVSLETQASVYLVQAGKKYLLIGVGGKQVSFLKEISEEELGDLLQPPIARPAFEPFKKQLDKLLKGKK